ncbi:DUF2917 domain-containing protein [Caldimonas brevitalea]|uniref:DUF2917 domain-containing protein n=1 Tax=Caldimonas brevitalea TaxID=413882 RepID=A0A0G3BL34_9BURK|nr:DUF2917 domain-containing protein [Caldimonas brevitalea]AKJ27250.1 hypothetical protein AAW51_0559 [Caldimonas brevitalea]
MTRTADATSLMSFRQQSAPSALPHAAPAPGDAVWSLAAGQAMTLKVRATTVLKVGSGRVWATGSGRPGHPATDVVLAAGEELRLHADEAIVIEGWPTARFEMMLAAPRLAATARPAPSPSRTSVWSRLSAWWAAAPAPQRACP